jgi:predicted RNase H-like HicB family nuclease
MEKLATIHVERLPEGVYLATSEDIQGLVAQGRTLWETLEIARDVARKLIDAKKQRNVVNELKPVTRKFDFPLVLEF